MYNIDDVHMSDVCLLNILTFTSLQRLFLFKLYTHVLTLIIPFKSVCV